MSTVTNPSAIHLAAVANYREDVTLAPHQRSLNPPEFRRLGSELLDLGLIDPDEIEPPGTEYDDDMLPDEQRVITLDPQCDDIAAILRGAGVDSDDLTIPAFDNGHLVSYDPLTNTFTPLPER